MENDREARQQRRNGARVENGRIIRRRGRPANQNRVPENPPPQPNLDAIIAALQQRLEAQEEEIRRLRGRNQAEQPAAPHAAPPVPQEQQIVHRPVRSDLFERFRRMKPSEFEGSSDPLEADEWLSKIKVILDFMDLSCAEKVKCATFVLTKDARYWWDTVAMRRDVSRMSWEDFLQEFNSKYFNMRAMNSQQKEFNNLKQGSMTVTEAVTKFDQLARLCPQLVPNELERVRRMMEMFRPEIALAIDSGNQPPTTVGDCVERALRAEYRHAQVKEERAQFFKTRKEEKDKGKQQTEDWKKPQNQNPNNLKRGFNVGNDQQNENGRNVQHRFSGASSIPTCEHCGRNHSGECWRKNLACHSCGKVGHFANQCPNQKPQQPITQQTRPTTSKVNTMQAAAQTMPYTTSDVEPPSQKAQIYAYTNADTLASSTK